MQSKWYALIVLQQLPPDSAAAELIEVWQWAWLVRQQWVWFVGQVLEWVWPAAVGVLRAAGELRGFGRGGRGCWKRKEKGRAGEGVWP